MNKDYIKELYEKYKEESFESEYEIDSPEDFESLMIDYVISNIQYDFNFRPDENKLFNLNKNIEKEYEEIEK